MATVASWPSMRVQLIGLFKKRGHFVPFLGSAGRGAQGAGAGGCCRRRRKERRRCQSRLRPTAHFRAVQLYTCQKITPGRQTRRAPRCLCHRGAATRTGMSTVDRLLLQVVGNLCEWCSTRKRGSVSKATATFPPHACHAGAHARAPRHTHLSPTCRHSPAAFLCHKVAPHASQWRIRRLGPPR